VGHPAYIWAAQFAEAHAADVKTPAFGWGVPAPIRWFVKNAVPPPLRGSGSGAWWGSIIKTANYPNLQSVTEGI
jgi:hypothetical protein